MINWWMKPITDDSTRLKEMARERIEDPFYQLLFSLAWASTLFIAANRPIEERWQLLAIDEALGDDLRPSISNEQLGLKPLKPDLQELVDRRMGAVRISESDRIARISEIETKFQDLCRRNYIDLDEPLTPEMQENVLKARAEKKHAIEPFELAEKNLDAELKRLMNIIIEKPIDPDIFMDKLRQLMERFRDINSSMKKISFLGPDAAAMSGDSGFGDGALF